jgi:hypothetical protein
MSIGRLDASSSPPAGILALFELQKTFVEPLLRTGRYTNTLLDLIFYDVWALTAQLLARGEVVITEKSRSNAPSASHPLEVIDLSAITNPSGSIIIVDTKRAPYARLFSDMKKFIAYANGADGAGLHTVSVTGVGSSAFGSVAFAWNISEAIGEPVAAVVPGYGLADFIPQALGGWFGFETYDRLQSATQSLLAQFAPSLAMIGKDLARTTPGHAIVAETGAPVFLYGSAASDDVHAILENVGGITRLVGHSKGALAIENALRSLNNSRPEKLSVLTFGCSIQENPKVAEYGQYLGKIDWLGLINSTGDIEQYRPFADHSTNTIIPLSLRVAALLQKKGS